MFHVEHFPNFLFLMALDIVQYKSGDPITAGLTYQIPGEINSDAWILQSTTQGAVFQMTATAPTDEDWTNIQDTQFHINGTVTGLVLPILAYGYFRVVKEPVTEHATMALVEQEFIMEIADPINPFVAGTPVAPGYYDLSSLNLEAGKMYVLSVLPVQDKDYPETPNIVTDETFSAVIVGLTGTKATQVILRGITTVGSHLFVMTGAKPILHLGGRSNVKFNITVSPVVFSAGGGSFDPSQPATITGLWDLQNVSGINLVDEGPIILGKGDNAVKIHGSGTGSAVIEGANGATLDIAVPVDFSEPVTFQDTVSYNRVGTTGEPIFQRWVMPRNTLVLKGYEAVGSFGFANADGSQNYIGIDTNGNVSFLKNTTHSGASTFSAGVTMGQTLTVAGLLTVNNNLVINPSNGGPTISANGGTVQWVQQGNPLRFQVQDTNVSVLFSGSASTANVDIQKPDAFDLTDGSLMNRKEADARYLKLAGGTVTGATTFNAGVTLGQTLSVAGKASFDGGIESDKAIILMDGFGVLSGSIEGYYGDPSNSGLSFKDSSSTTFLRLNYHNGAKRVEVLLPTPDSSLSLPVLQSLSVDGAVLVNSLQLGPSDIKYTGTSITATGNWTFTSAATFNAGVTMGQTLTVTGAINSNGGLNLADGQGIQFGTSISMYSSGADFWIEGPANGKVGLNLPIEFPAPAEGTTLTDNMGVNVAMGDARYAKVVSLTKAAYTALTTKDPTTIYLITDTTPRMWAIGDMEIVTSDMPA